MKRIFYKVLGFWSLVLLPILGVGQETLTVGGPWNASNPDPLKYWPIGLWYKNSISQVIYTKEELAELSGSMITALTYTLNSKPTSNFESVQLQVYIAKTNLEEFESQQFITIDGMEQVATIQMGTFESTTHVLPLDNPYLYDGSSNLMVTIIRRKTGTTTQNIQYQCFDNTSDGENTKKRNLFAQTDNNELDEEDISTIDISTISDSKRDWGTIRPITTFTYERQSDGAVLKLSPKELNFGWQRAGQTAQLPFKVVNSGKQTLTIGSVAIPDGLGTITPAPASVQVVSGGEQEFTFNLTDQAGTYSDNVVFNAPDAEPATANLHISALVYPQTALFESFEESDALPVLFRNRTGECAVKTNSSSASAYDGEKFVEFNTDNADTLIFPKLKGTVYMYLKANSSWKTPTVSILQSSDLQQWSEPTWDKPTLSTSYVQVKIEAGSDQASFLAVAGKAFSLDKMLILEPVFPVHDLNFVSWTVPDVLNERSKAEFSVKVSNWGTSEEEVVLELIDQENRVLATKNFGVLPAKEEKDCVIEWTPAEGDRGVTAVQCRIVLGTDEDLTNQVSALQPVKVVPYLPVVVFEPQSLFFEPLALDAAASDTLLKISNTGIAPLNVTAMTVAEPFTLAVSAPFVLNAKSDTNIRVVMQRKNFSGVHAADIEITHEGGTLRLPVAGLIKTRNSLCESFESGEWPPLGWRRLTETTRGWKLTQWGAKNGSYYVERGSEADTLVTPKLNVAAGDKMIFWAKSADGLSLLYSADLKTWKELHQYQKSDFDYKWQGYCVEFPETGSFYVAFASDRISLDYVQGPEIVVADKDLRVAGIPVCPAAGNKYADVEYEVYVRNTGSQTAEDYTVQLLHGDEVLASSPGKPVAYLDTAKIKLVYLPLEEGLLENLRIRVVYEGDAEQDNNVSEAFSLLVRAEFYGETVVGTEDHTVAANRQRTGLWESMYDYSLQEFHYSAAQLGIRSGSKIKNISYLVANQTADIQTPLSIWMGKKTDQSVTTAWSDISELTPVYAAETTVPKTTTDENIGWGRLELSEPYTYDGGDLVIMVERNGKYKGFDFLVNKSSENVRRFYKKDNVGEGIRDIALAEGSSDQTYPTLKFVYDMPSIEVRGKVVGEDGVTAVADATVSLTSGEVVYRVKTGTDGSFVLEMSRTGRDYELSIESEGLFFAPETVSIGTEDQDLGTFSMTAHPVKLSVAVDGGEGLPLQGLTVLVSDEASSKTYTHTSGADNTKDTLAFENLKAGLYHVSLKHSAYKDTALDVALTDKDTVLAVMLREKDPIFVAGKVLSSVTSKGLEDAAVVLHDLKYGFEYKDSTDADGLYRIAVRTEGKYVRTITALSYRKSVDTVTVATSPEDVSLSDVTLRLDNIVVVLNIVSTMDLSGAVAVLTDNADAQNTQTASIAGTRFIFDNLLPATYTLEIKRGQSVLYTDNAFEIAVSRSETITLGQPVGNGTLTVRVLTDNGDEPDEVEIYLMNEYSGMVYDEYTDNTGVKVFEDLAFGTYRFGVYKDGFLPHEEMLEFVADATLDITLKEQRVAPYALNTEVVYNTDNGQADLRMGWNDIGEYFYDGFEDYEDFSIDFEPWTLIDVDGSGTAAVRNAVYPHRGEPVAAMVFNPYSTTPASTNAAFAPLTGAKYMAFFCAVGKPSDDWAIAPKRMIRNGDKLMISFRQLVEGAAPEHFTVCVSTTGTDPEDFIVVSNGNYISSEARWLTFLADMSSFAGQEVHVAIHYISDNTGDMLMIDDFFIGAVPEKLASVPAGKWISKSTEKPLVFNRPFSRLGRIRTGSASALGCRKTFRIYLDGELKDSVNTTSYTFTDVAPGVHTVGVSQMYKGGESEITEAQVTVEDYKAVSARWELRLSTNTDESCQAAQVSLTDTAGRQTLYTVGADNKLTVNYLRKGSYTLRVNLPGFDPVSQPLSHQSASITEIELTESIVAPANLFVQVSKAGQTYIGTFTWNTQDGFNEGFESYADFTQSIGQWKNIDRDGLNNFGVSNCSFPGMSEPSAAVVYNPSATTPSTSGDNNVRPHSGSKEVVFFSTDQGTPDDWLISPVQNIRDNYQLRFFAKSYSNMYGLESVSVLVSETGTEPESFKPLRQIKEIPIEWTEYVVDLSDYRGKDIYVAFHYTQANTFFMMLDDIYIGPSTGVKAGTSRAKSYNVYLDGKSVGSVTEPEYIFKNLEVGRTYEAGVEAVYASGTSAKSLYSFKVNEVSVEGLDKATDMVSVYPNPARSGSEIQVKAEQGCTVRFFNLSGRAVTERIHLSSQTFRLPQLSAGLYIIEVQSDRSTTYGKLTVF